MSTARRKPAATAPAPVEGNGQRMARPRATFPAADAMNKTERLYSHYLDIRLHGGEIARWDFQSVKLRLADLTWYTPDFRVILRDGTEEYHEVKGFMRDDAAVKIKVAAELHPYPFVVVRWSKGAFHFERFEGKQR